MFWQVFGAYCSNKWLDRNQKDERGNRTTYFGTGETFLFSLQPERRKYPWVGIENDSKNHSNELFMAADPQMITIGGGYVLSIVFKFQKGSETVQSVRCEFWKSELFLPTAFLK